MNSNLTLSVKHSLQIKAFNLFISKSKVWNRYLLTKSNYLFDDNVWYFKVYYFNIYNVLRLKTIIWHLHTINDKFALLKLQSTKYSMWNTYLWILKKKEHFTFLMYAFVKHHLSWFLHQCTTSMKVSGQIFHWRNSVLLNLHDSRPKEALVNNNRFSKNEV